jgi:SulP family sulfate permease
MLLHAAFPLFPSSTGAATTPATRSQNDMIAAVIVTIMLIPQSLAYALLAGCRPRPALRLDPADHPLCDLRHLPGAGGRPGGGGLADDRRRGGPGGRAGHGGLRGGRADAGGPVGRHPAAWASCGWVSRQFPQPSGDRGLHHRVGHPDRRQPAQAYPGHRGARPYAARDALLAERAHGRREPDHAGHRRGGDRVPVLGAQGAEALAARAGAGPRLADIAHQGRAGGRGGGHDALVWGLGLADRGVAIVGEVPQACRR